MVRSSTFIPPSVPMRLAAFLLPALFLGCSPGYYVQAVRGQAELLWKRRPVETLARQPDLPADLRRGLETVAAAREFAAEALHLDPGGNYRAYVDLGRPWVVWNVVAAPEFDLTPRSWCYPVAGCLSYRGWFSERAAREAARKLADGGWDVAVGGVPAYSTLGWFDDPILSSFVRYPPVELVALIIHELAHRRLYVPGDTAFNEGFAVFVEQEGVRRWLRGRAGDGEGDREYARYLQGYRRQREFVALLRTTRGRLERVYRQEMPPAEKRTAKAAAFSRLQADYRRLRANWKNDSRYDAWFDRPLNNAHLAAVAAYNDLVPGFQRLLAETGGDLARFYERCEALANQSAENRREALDMKPPGRQTVQSAPQNRIRRGETNSRNGP